MFTLNPDSEALRVKLQRVSITRDLIKELHDQEDVPPAMKATFAEWLDRFDVDLRKLLTEIVQLDLRTLLSQPLIISTTNEDKTGR